MTRATLDSPIRENSMIDHRKIAEAERRDHEANVIRLYKARTIKEDLGVGPGFWVGLFLIAAAASIFFATAF